MEDDAHAMPALRSRYPAAIAADSNMAKGQRHAPELERLDAREVNVSDVHVLRFFTPDPSDHCVRALDLVRRMGFDLVSVWARPSPGTSFLVHLDFVPLGELPPHVLADRVSGFIGVTGVEMTGV